jgi:hypothetical protein
MFGTPRRPVNCSHLFSPCCFCGKSRIRKHSRNLESHFFFILPSRLLKQVSDHTMIHRPPSIPTSKQHKATSPTRRPYHKTTPTCFSQIHKTCCRPTAINNTEDVSSTPSFAPPLLVPESDIGDNSFFLVAPSKVNKPPQPAELTVRLSSSAIHHFLQPRVSKTQCHPCYYEQTELFFLPIFDGKQPSKPSPAHLLPHADIVDYASLNQTTASSINSTMKNTLVVSTLHPTPPTRAAMMLKPRGTESTKNAATASSLSLPLFPIW